MGNFENPQKELNRTQIRLLETSNPKFPAQLSQANTRLSQGKPATVDLPNAIWMPIERLFVQGSPADFENCVAVVGTRTPESVNGYDTQSLNLAMRKFIHALRQIQHEVKVVSGLAAGTDAVAHQIALESSIPTIAALFTQRRNIYPQQNIGLAAQIATTNGSGLLYEEPISDLAQRLRPLARNRTIAALAGVTVIFPASYRSGTLNTGLWAKQFDRPILAITVDQATSPVAQRMIDEGIITPDQILNIDTGTDEIDLAKLQRILSPN